MMKRMMAVFFVLMLLLQQVSVEAFAQGLTTNVGANEMLEQSMSKTNSDSYPVVLDSDKIGQNLSYDSIIFSKEQNGIYFLKTVGQVYSNNQSYEIVFYDIAKDTYTTVYEIAKVDTSYVAEDAVYFANYTSRAESNDNATDTNNTYIYDITIYRFNLISQKADSISLSPISSKSNWVGYLTAIGVDDDGRIYVATNDKELHLFNFDGMFLSKSSYTGQINQFYGFDKTNGNFYYRGMYNWGYWGYDHYMSSLMAGNVSKDYAITLPEANLMILYQTGFFDHCNPIQMLNEQYLAALTTFSDNTLMILDSNKYDVSDHTEQSTSISLVDSGVSVSVLNIENSDAIQMAIQTAGSVYENNADISSIGPRCAISPDGGSIYVKTEQNLLTEYGMDKEKKIQLKTTYPIYTFAVTDDVCQVIEREGDTFYLETINRAYPTDFSIEAPDSLQVGESGEIQCSTDGLAVMDYSFLSSDSKILHVDDKGKINAWKAGKVTLTVTATPGNIVRTFTITVKDSNVSNANSYNIIELAGSHSNIIHQPRNYGRYGNTIDAYLTPLSSGEYERVEYMDSKVVIEKYNVALELETQTYLECELPIWGGFYSGSEYNFLVFGQINEQESNECEVVRVVKYDKNWNRLGECAVKSANTYIPFDAGSCSMTELNGMLYIHTCHEMYQSDDGYHHQANCTFKIQESNMSLVDSYTGVMNLGEGYVSHSFMQFIRTDGKDIYRADLGDAYPRGIALTRTSGDEKLMNPVMYASVVEIPGGVGNNYTGYALGGLDLSESNYMIVGSGIKSSTDNISNIFINSGSKDRWNLEVEWITNYDNNSNVQVQPPKLVKLNANQFMIMWEEFDKITGLYQTTQMALLNPNGELASNIYSIPLALSACPPIVNEDGTVSWFVTEKNAPQLITVNPYLLDDVQKKTVSLNIFKTVPDQSGQLGETNQQESSGQPDQSDMTGELNQPGQSETEDTTSKEQQNIDLKKENKEQIPKNISPGDILVIKNQKYIVNDAKTVTWNGSSRSNESTIEIPSYINVNGKKYQITAIAANACKNNKKLNKLVIGAKIKSISKNAFYGCRSLKNVCIKSKVLKEIGKNAFYKTHKKIKFSLPKSKYKNYKMKLKRSKLPKYARIY